jgi:hypothetical protein
MQPERSFGFGGKTLPSQIPCKLTKNVNIHQLMTTALLGGVLHFGDGPAHQMGYIAGGF